MSYRIRKLTRGQIASVLAQDLDGDEQVMKEVWEECRTDDEVNAARAELTRIIAWLRGGM